MQLFLICRSHSRGVPPLSGGTQAEAICLLRHGIIRCRRGAAVVSRAREREYFNARRARESDATRASRASLGVTTDESAFPRFRGDDRRRARAATTGDESALERRSVTTDTAPWRRI